jgi:hypothetical protein
MVTVEQTAADDSGAKPDSVNITTSQLDNTYVAEWNLLELTPFSWWDNVLALTCGTSERTVVA